MQGREDVQGVRYYITCKQCGNNQSFPSYHNEVKQIVCLRCKSLLFEISFSEIYDYNKAVITRLENI